MADEALVCPKGRHDTDIDRSKCRVIEDDVIADSAILMQDIMLAELRLKTKPTAVNENIPSDVFLDSVQASLERLEEEGIDTKGWEEKVFEGRGGLDAWSKEEAVENLDQLKFDLRNETFDFKEPGD